MLTASTPIQPSDLTATKELVRLHEKFASRVLHQCSDCNGRETSVVSQSLPFNCHGNHQVNKSSGNVQQMSYKLFVSIVTFKNIKTSYKGSDLLSPLKDVHCYQLILEPETFHTVRLADDNMLARLVF